MLYCFDGLAYGEIAARLGMSMDSVGQVMQRARQKLAKAGLSAWRRDVVDDTKVIVMDPGRIEKISGRRIRGRW